MRALAGLIALNGLFAAVGLGLLGAVGLLRLRVRALVEAVPAALLAGAALTGIAGTVFLVAGATLDLPPFVAAMLVVAVVLWSVAVWRRRRRGEDPATEEPVVDDRTARRDRWITRLVILGVVVFVLLQAYESRNLRAAWDAEHNWTLKALALTTGGLEGDLFTGSVPFSTAHLDYPILQPVLGALVFRFAGKFENGLLVFELWLLAGAFVLTVPWLARRRFRAWLMLLPPAIALAALTSWGILRSEADVTVAIFLGAGALALALWIDDGPPGLAVVAAVLLAAALNTKNEGLAYTIPIVVTAALVLGVTAPRRLLPFAGVVLALVASLAPWRLWMAANGPFARDVTPLSTSLDTGFLADRLNRLDFAAQTVLNRFSDTVSHAWIMPVFLAVAISALVTGPHRRVAAFYVVTVVGAVLTLLWVYWTTNQPDWSAHITRTSVRTIAGPLFIAAAGLAHLLSRAEVGTALREPRSAVHVAQRGGDDRGSRARAGDGEGAMSGPGVAPQRGDA